MEYLDKKIRFETVCLTCNTGFQRKIMAMRRIQYTKQNCWKANIFPHFHCFPWFFGGELPVKQWREETYTILANYMWDCCAAAAAAAASSSCVEYETGNQRHYVIYVSVEPYANNNPSAVLLHMASAHNNWSQLKLHPKNISPFSSKSHSLHLSANDSTIQS